MIFKRNEESRLGFDQPSQVGGHYLSEDVRAALVAGTRRAQKWGVGTSSSARLRLASRAACSGALAAGTLRGLLWGDRWPVVLGAELEQAPQCTHGPRTSPQP